MFSRPDQHLENRWPFPALGGVGHLAAVQPGSGRLGQNERHLGVAELAFQAGTQTGQNLLERHVAGGQFQHLVPFTLDVGDRGFAFGDVALDRNPVGVPAVFVGHRGNAQLHPERRTVFAVVDHFHLDGLPGPQCRLDLVERPAVRLRALQDARGLSQHVVQGVAGGAGKRLVGVQDPGAGGVKRLGLSDQHRVIRERQHRLQQRALLLGQPQPLLIGGQLMGHTDQAEQLGTFGERRGLQLQHSGGAVRAQLVNLLGDRCLAAL